MVLARHTSRSGLSTQGTLLLVLGGGLALGLIVLLPRLDTARAGEPRAERASAGAVQESPANPPEEPPPATLAELPEANGSAPETAGATSPAPTTATLLAAGAAPESAAPTKPEGPKLKYERGGKKEGMIQPGALRAEQRERREERLAREAAEAAALGLPPPIHPKVAPPPPSRENLDKLRMEPKRNGQKRDGAPARGGKKKGKDRSSPPKGS